MPPMYISFTGHRDRTCDETLLEDLRKEFPGAIWVTGGAIGFDRQVHKFAEIHHIKEWIIKPDYAKCGGHDAPLKRDIEIAKAGNLLIALYDGRQYGGTYFTLKEARKQGKEIRIWKPLVPKK